MRHRVLDRFASVVALGRAGAGESQARASRVANQTKRVMFVTRLTSPRPGRGAGQADRADGRAKAALLGGEHVLDAIRTRALWQCRG